MPALPTRIPRALVCDKHTEMPSSNVNRLENGYFFIHLFGVVSPPSDLACWGKTKSRLFESLKIRL